MNKAEIISKVEGIKSDQHPHYEDAYIDSATYRGNQLNEYELEQLNQDIDYVFEQVEQTNLNNGYSFNQEI